MGLRIRLLSAACCAAVLIGCRGGHPPEERTDDGLVRVPSRATAGVYRAVEADFTGYRRLMLEPLVIEYAPEWRRQHRDIDPRELRRLEADARQLFREAFVAVLVDEGPYELAETRDPDVLHVIPRIVDLDVPAPDPHKPGVQTFAPHPVRMQITGELRDGATGALLMRVMVFEGDDRYPFNEAREVSRASNTHEMRIGFAKWSRSVREALDVAKVQRPRD